MKDAILISLMVAVVATPCMAQEIKPNILFSIEETLWEAVPVYSDLGLSAGYLRFSMGKVYDCRTRDGENCGIYSNSAYLDLFWAGLPSIFYIVEGEMLLSVAAVGWALPIVGVGAIAGVWFPYHLIPVVSTYALIKTSDSWTPASE